MTDSADAIREATLDLLNKQETHLPSPQEVATLARVPAEEVAAIFTSEANIFLFLLQPLVESMDHEVKPLTIHRVPTMSQQREALTAAIRACVANPRQVHLLRSMLGSAQGSYRNQTVDAFSYQNGLRFIGTEHAADPVYLRRVHFVAELVGAAFGSHRHDITEPETFNALVDSCMGILNPPHESQDGPARFRPRPRGQLPE